MRIKYVDEADLQRKLVKLLNRRGYHFSKTKSDFCDLIDDINKICIEVKPEKFSPAQILYGLAREGISEIKYIGLACAYELRLYNPPAFPRIIQFAKEIDPDLKRSPSTVSKSEWNEKAFGLLKDHIAIYTYDGKLDLGVKEIFLDEKNLEYYKEILGKYRINPAKFIHFIEDVYAKGQGICVNSEGWLLNENTGEFFENDGKTTLYGRDRGYKPIKDFRDTALLRATRVRSEDIRSIFHQFDRLETITSRRSKGRYFTKDKISREIASIAEELRPDFIIEPYVGGGSLIEPLISNYAGIGNDINEGFIRILDKKYAGGGKWNFTSLDTITTHYGDLIKNWGVPSDVNLLILTNPPFGTVSTNILASKKTEIKDGKESRTKHIEYGTVKKKYGAGDLVIPAIGKMIDFIKAYGRGTLAFFCPAGVFCGRLRYLKLFKALLKDFEFLEGHIFSGENFNTVSTKKAIAFTIWKYCPNNNTRIDSLVFTHDGEGVKLKALPLLKDGWNYDNRKRLTEEIAVQHNAIFCNLNPKIFHLTVEKGGSEVVPRNVKIDLKIPNLPSELVYALWSVAIGRRSTIIDSPKYPHYVAEAYLHLPDFSKKETMEILAYIVITTLFVERKNNYCGGRIGFANIGRDFKFGGERLTSGAKHLIDTYGYCPVGSKTIREIFDELKNERTPTEIPVKDYRHEIRKEVMSRLDKIGYWDYIPIPMSMTTQQHQRGKTL